MGPLGSLAILVFMAACVPSTTAIDLRRLERSWQSHKIKFRRNYNPGEEKLRKTIFLKNLQLIDEHNKLFKTNRSTFFVGPNQFTDWTPKELSLLGGAKPLNRTIPIKPIGKRVRNVMRRHGIPANLDLRWRPGMAIGMGINAGTVHNIRHQGRCGSCWAHATVSALEARYALQNKKFLRLSIQQLVDCVYADKGSHGCQGGTVVEALQHIISIGGILPEWADPYTGRMGVCPNNDQRLTQHKLSLNLRGVRAIVPNREDLLRWFLFNKGPLAIHIVTNRNFANYQGGIFSDPTCPKLRQDPATRPPHTFDHAVLLVGYGVDPSGTNYWIVMNSWGTSWGEGGYMRMAMNTNQCGMVSEYVYYPEFG